MTSLLPMFCALCESAEIRPRFVRHGRQFFECSVCDLLFVDRAHFLSTEEEKLRYQAHQNSYEDSGYRNSLSELKDTLKKKLSLGMRGLDFGSGSSDAMARLWQEDGYRMERYDPHFGPQLPAQEQFFDFITVNEVVEHLRHPLREFNLMIRLLRDVGWIGIKTGLRDNHRLDPDWWYLRDVTHLCFYSRRTFEWIAVKLGLTLEFATDNIILLSPFPKSSRS